MSKQREKRPHGQIRQSQLVTTFGPGSMVDLPNHSVLIAGLEFWVGLGERIVEKRLTDNLCRLLQLPTIELFSPPPEQDDPLASATGIRAWQFPEWFIVQEIERKESDSAVRSRLLVHRSGLSRGKYIDDNKKRRSVVPVRFVRACRSGHISDIDWYGYVHGGRSDCPQMMRKLWIEERGTSGDIMEVSIRCECKKSRPLSDASVIGAIGTCEGWRPWLGPAGKEKGCGEPNRLLIRTASNSYFPQTLSVISLPDRNEQLQKVVDAAWDFLETVESLDDLVRERRKSKVKAALEGFSDDELFAEISSRRGGGTLTKSVKEAELETLMASKEEVGEDRPDGNFLARALALDKWNKPWMKSIERVVLVHRLREVVAEVGFTRFEAAAPDIQGELEMGVRRAALAKEVSWLPAIENRGEGFFLQFRKEEIENWVARSDVQQRGRMLKAGFDSWMVEHAGSRRQFFGLPYIMLHSFSHLLITAVSLECGYPASSIRERIYALPEIGYGILLYTGTSDAEGTLGGLVEVGRRIHEHVRSALEIGDLCSNDPVCAQHDPVNEHERRFLHGAACHGCLLIGETSCEQHNDFLDRALVVQTVDGSGVEFFPNDLL